MSGENNKQWPCKSCLIASISAGSVTGCAAEFRFWWLNERSVASCCVCVCVRTRSANVTWNGMPTATIETLLTEEPSTPTTESAAASGATATTVDTAVHSSGDSDSTASTASPASPGAPTSVQAAGRVIAPSLALAVLVGALVLSV